jgi:hypothetical protein
MKIQSGDQIGSQPKLKLTLKRLRDTDQYGSAGWSL